MFVWNIRNQILATGLLSLLVFVAAIGYFYDFSRSQFREHTDSLIIATGQQYADRVSRVLSSQANAFNRWVGDDIYGIALEFNTTSELERDFEQRLNDNDGYALLALVDNQGRIAAVATGSALSSGSSVSTGQILDEYSSIEAGDSRRAAFMKCPTLADLGAESDHSYVFYSPAYSSEGKRNGALVAIVDWNAVQFEVNAFYETFASKKYDGARAILSLPQSRTAAAVVAQSTNATGVDQVVAEMSTRAAGQVAQCDAAGQSLLVGASAVRPPTFEGVDPKSAEPLQLLMAIPESDIMASLNSQLTVIIIFGLIGAAMVMGISYWVARRISTRIGRVTGIAVSMASGHIDQEIDTSARDEVGALSKAFSELSNYMREMADAARSIANGNLSVEAKPRSDQDVLGLSFKAMVANLSGLISQVSQSAQGLLTASGEIASTSEQMSRGAANQSDQVNQISTAVEEMTANVIEGSKYATEAREFAEKATSTAQDGGLVVSETIQGMQKIAEVVRQSAQSITDLAKSADQIGEITLVIDEIADQTNLLALNAAIEAARAGEQGRGFAVVADEVRKLAERTGSATAEITAMIKDIQNKTEEAVHSMESGIQQVDKGRELADKAGNSLSSIVTMSQDVASMIKQIAAGTEQQSSATEEVAKTLEHIASVSREAATGAQESSSAADQLSRQAETLNTLVAKFTVKAK